MKYAQILTALIYLLTLSPHAFGSEQNTPVAPITSLASRVYQSCESALKLKTNSDFQQTYCGSFFLGYNLGFLLSNWATFTEPKEDDPCKTEKKLQIETIKNRFSEFEKSVNTSIPNSALISVLPFMKWAKTHQNDIAKSGDDILTFNKYLYAEPAPPDVTKKIMQDYLNSPLARVKVENVSNEYWPNDEFDHVSLEQEYLQCKNDLKNFSGSLCEAQILGYLSAIHSNIPFITKKIDAISNKKTLTQCDQEALELYRQFDVPQTQCVTPSTSAQEIAALFVKQYEHSISREAYDKDISNEEYERAVTKYKKLNGVGTVGYFVLYSGSNCTK